MKISQKFTYIFLIYPFSILFVALIFYIFQKESHLVNAAVYIILLYYIGMSVSFNFVLKKESEKLKK